MSESQSPQSQPHVNGVAVNELPNELQFMFDRVMKLQKAYQEAQAVALQKKAAVEELSSMLAEEIEQFKASENSDLSEQKEVDTENLTE